VNSSAQSGTINVQKGAKVQGDIVLEGTNSLQLDGDIKGNVVVYGKGVKITGTGKITGGIKYISDAQLTADSDITKITVTALEQPKSLKSGGGRSLGLIGVPQ
jgi:hypothetical protein